MSELSSRIKEIIETEDVVVFMKGTPQWAMCGNSMRALEALRAVEAPIAAVDILPNPEYRRELSAISGWPTIPQVFVKGELIGGADIVQELAVNGELQQKLVAALGDDYRSAGDERTLALATPSEASEA
jgi:monothiol glutaredoxin